MDVTEFDHNGTIQNYKPCIFASSSVNSSCETQSR